MNTHKLATDSLWRCLCPSFTTSALKPQPLRNSRAALVQQPRRRLQTQCLNAANPKPNTRAAAPRAALTLRRPVAPTSNKDDGTRVAHVHSVAVAEPGATASRAPAHTFDTFSPGRFGARDTRGDRRGQRAYEETTGIRVKERPGPMTLEYKETWFLYEKARLAAFHGEYHEARRIVNYLVREREEAPSLRLYSILILANVGPEEGAAWRVAMLLKDMADEGLALDSAICHDVLKVLSVHVDHLLRADMLAYMQQRWFDLTEDGHHSVTAGLFREGQLELGLDQLQLMRHEGIRIHTWLYDLAAYTLTECEEYGSALQLVREQMAVGGVHVSRGVWSHLLEKASGDFHHEATAECWKNQVTPGYLNPSSGTCLNVLTTAARAGDALLATEAFHVLGLRGANFQPIHYEQLLATYLQCDPPDLRAALTVLTIMTSVKLEPDSITTRPLFTFLVEHQDRCAEAFDIITSLHEAGRTVPIAAVNVIIEALGEARLVEPALRIYKAMHLFEHSLPNVPHKPFANVETFNLLLRAAYRTQPVPDLQSALFLAAEMLALGIKPNALTYDRLIYICVLSQKWDHAIRYFEEMDSLNFRPRIFTAAIFVVKLARAGDARCWDVLQRLQDQDLLHPKTKSEVEFAWAGSHNPSPELSEVELAWEDSQKPDLVPDQPERDAPPEMDERGAVAGIPAKENDHTATM